MIHGGENNVLSVCQKIAVSLFVCAAFFLNACQGGSFNIQKIHGISVGGKVDGLRSDSLRLTMVSSSDSSAQQSVEVYPPGGDFHFRKAVKLGTRFRLNVDTDPRHNSCVIRSSSSFSATDDIDEIVISCSSVF